jgi:ketosteroid isomerase-like protein
MTISANLDAERAKNVEISKKLMASFKAETWFDLLHDDLVLEFPYAYSVKMPGQVVGKADCVAYLSNVMKYFTGLVFTDVVINTTQDADKLIVEYSGHCTLPNGVVYTQTYATIQKFRDGKMILFREFWNPMAVVDSFGPDLGAVFV